MTCTKNCMSIDAIVGKDTLPLSPPDSFTSRSPTLSPKSVYMVPPIIPSSEDNNNPSSSSSSSSMSLTSTQYPTHIKQEDYDDEDDHQHHHNHLHHHNSMSPEERRYRNKLASAKYRAKKQASMKFMTTKLSELMSTNTLLEQELTKVKQENAMLRAMNEKMMAATRQQQYL